MKYLKCKYCDKTISVPNLPRHIKVCATSKTARTPYRLDHDDLFCKFCGRESRTRNSLIQHEIRCKNNPNKLVINYVRIGFNNPGRAAWNKGLTKDTNESIFRAAANYKINYRLGKHKPQSRNAMQVPEIRVKHKAKMQEVYSNYHPGHTKGFKQGYYKHIWCDSSWELAYLIYLFDHNIPVCRNVEGFNYLWEGDKHSYFPDFYLTNCKYFVEIKGYMSKRDAAKISQFPYPILVLQEKELLPILHYVINKYGENFISLYDDKH